MSLKKAAAFVRKQNNFIITTHTNPEGDALGAAVAFYFLLKKLGKSAAIIIEDKVPLSYSFLPGIESIRKLKYSPKRRMSFGCLVYIDCSDERRTGEVYRINAENRPTLNIDHHISNERFASLNWVEPHLSSCAEMIYRFYKKMGVPLDKDVATCLYAGMLSDTGSFRYSNTGSSTHKAVSELLKYGIDIPGIYRGIYEDIPFEDMKLLTQILPRMRREAKGKIIWFQIKQKMLRNKKLTFDLSEHVLSFARAIKGVEVCALFKENLGVKDEIRVNLRSQGKVDVNKVASCFGGGGHRTASGATVHGKIDQVRKKVLAKIREYLK